MVTPRTIWSEVEEFLCALKSDPPPGIVVPNSPGHVSSSQSCHALVDVLSDRFAPYGYEVLSELGRGGMAIVYKARELRLDRPVALKMVLSGAHTTQESVDRFCREAEAIAKLDHPNIVQIYEIGEHEEQPFLALELVTGQSLAQFIDGSPQSARWSAELVETLARAIHATHLVNIIHRDLKPANVLLTVSGVPKITDFGLAKRLDGQAAFPTLAEAVSGHTQLHGSGAGRAERAHVRLGGGERDLCGGRRLRPGSDPLRAAHWPSAVLGRDAAGDSPSGTARGSRPAHSPAGRKSPETWRPFA